MQLETNQARSSDGITGLTTQDKVKTNNNGVPSYLVAFSLDSTKSISLSLSIPQTLTSFLSFSSSNLSKPWRGTRNHLVKAKFVASWSGVGTWRYSGFHFRYVRAGSSSGSLFFFTASATWLRMHSCGVRWSLWAGKDSGAIWARLRQRYWFPSSRSLNHSRKTGDDVGEEKWGWTPVAKALASGSLYRICSFCVK